MANGENVQELGVKAGWLKVREGGKTTSEDKQDVLDRLEQLQDEAQAAKVGMWNDAEKVRLVTYKERERERERRKLIVIIPRVFVIYPLLLKKILMHF